jgi:D-methionine transport system substrate-binding protein
MKKIKGILSILLTATVLGVSLIGCQNTTANESSASAAEKKEIKFGVAPGPYGDLVKQAIQPELEKKGYQIKIVEFSDYIQPDTALGNSEIDVNVFQHEVYLKNFAKEHNLQIESIINIPTAGMGIFSEKYKNIDELSDGDTVSLPNDVPNLARGLRFLEQVGLVTLKKDVDLTKVSEKDIATNPKNLKFVPVEAAQLPRTLDSSSIAVITGNYAISSGLKLSDALVREKLTEEYKNVIAIRIQDKDSQFVKDILEVVKGAEFKKVVLDDNNQYKAFDFPEWFSAK